MKQLGGISWQNLFNNTKEYIRNEMCKKFYIWFKICELSVTVLCGRFHY
jgi:hypothetical protein